MPQLREEWKERSCPRGLLCGSPLIKAHEEQKWEEGETGNRSLRTTGSGQVEVRERWGQRGKKGGLFRSLRRRSWGSGQNLLPSKASDPLDQVSRKASPEESFYKFLLCPSMEREALIQKESMSYEFPSGDSKIIVSPPSSSGSLMPGALHSGWAQPHQILVAPMSTSQALVHLVRPRADDLKVSSQHLSGSCLRSPCVLWEHNGISILGMLLIFTCP